MSATVVAGAAAVEDGWDEDCEGIGDGERGRNGLRGGRGGGLGGATGVNSPEKMPERSGASSVATSFVSSAL